VIAFGAGKRLAYLVQREGESHFLDLFEELTSGKKAEIAATIAGGAMAAIFTELEEIFGAVYLRMYLLDAGFGVFTADEDVGTAHHLFAAKVLGVFIIEFEELFV